MSRALALEHLGLGGQSFGPCFADEYTHAEFVAQWRGSVPAPSEAQIDAAKLAAAKKMRRASLGLSCRADITSGFVSNALGTNHTYSSDIESQINISGRVQESFLFANSGPWTAVTPVTVGHIARTADTLRLYLCTVPGTTGAVEPVWPLTGSIGDGATVQWTPLKRWDGRLKCADANGVVARRQHSHDQIRLIGLAAVAHISAQLSKLEQKFADVEAAADMIAVRSITW